MFENFGRGNNSQEHSRTETLSPKIRRFFNLAPAAMATFLSAQVYAADEGVETNTGLNNGIQLLIEDALTKAEQETAEFLSRPDEQLLAIVNHDVVRTRFALLDTLKSPDVDSVDHRILMQREKRVTGFHEIEAFQLGFQDGRTLVDSGDRYFFPGGLRGPEFWGRSDEAAIAEEKKKQIEYVQNELRTQEDFCLGRAQLTYSLKSNIDDVSINGKQEDRLHVSSAYVARPNHEYSRSIISGDMPIQLSGEGTNVVEAYQNALFTGVNIGTNISEKLDELLELETPMEAVRPALEALGVNIESTNQNWRSLYDGVDSDLNLPAISASLQASQSFLCVTDWSADVSENKGVWKVVISGNLGELDQ